MKFLIIGDLHGQIPKVRIKDFDAIIAPGDFCSDELKPYMFEEVKQFLKNPKAALTWYEMLGAKKSNAMMKKSLADGRIILEKLNKYNKPVYLVPGNWDWTGRKDKTHVMDQDYFDKLMKGLKNLVNVHNKSIILDEIQIIGHGITFGPEYPQQKDEIAKFTKKELNKVRKNYDKKYSDMNKLFLKTKKSILFLTHNVPYNTTLDLIKNKESPRYGKHFGSLLARELIDKHQPLICIGAHMHENFGKCKIGKTVCINAGFGSDVNVFLEIKNGKILKLEFLGKNKA